MTNLNDTARKLAAIVCTVVVSATMVLGAVGPATAMGGTPVTAGRSVA